MSVLRGCGGGGCDGRRDELIEDVGARGGFAEADLGAAALCAMAPAALISARGQCRDRKCTPRNDDKSASMVAMEACRSQSDARLQLGRRRRLP